MRDFAAVGRQRVGRLHVFEEYGTLRGPDEGSPVRRLPCFVVYPEFSKRALLNGSHGSPVAEADKTALSQTGSVRKWTREGALGQKRLPVYRGLGDCGGPAIGDRFPPSECSLQPI